MDLEKKMQNIKEKENMLNENKKEKEKFRTTLKQHSQFMKEELEEKKKKNVVQKNEMNKGLKESSVRNKNDKVNKYKKAQEEKKVAEDKVSSDNKTRDMNNKAHIAEIKKEEEKIREILKLKKFMKERLKKI